MGLSSDNLSPIGKTMKDNGLRQIDIKTITKLYEWAFQTLLEQAPVTLPLLSKFIIGSIL